MKKLLVTFAAVAALAVSGIVMAQGHGGGGGSMGGGSHGGGWSGGSGGGWSGGHSGQGGSWSGGHGGSWSGGHGGYYGGYRGGYYGGGYRGYYGWRGGYWGPGFGVYLGGPGWWGWPYAYATYGYPYGNAYAYDAYPGYGAFGSTTYITDEVAPSYVAPQTAPAPNSYWYYCVDPAGYYPYVKTCNKTWMQVIPQNNPGAQVAPQLAP